MKHSRQRELVLEAVARAGNHPSADEVFQRIRGERPTISLATVYRNLSLLCDMGQIMKISLPAGGDRYDKNPAVHHHLLCRVCGELHDVPMVYDAGLDRAMAAQTGHAVAGHTIQFTGVCRDCQRKAPPQ